jgi:hypothetical protein
MINQDEIFSKLNEGMLLERSRAFRINLSKNKSLITECGGLRPVVERFSGKHLLVIGSGPSLDSCYDVLKKLRLREDVIFLASDMALRPLCEHGIYPQYVITCETTPTDFFSGIDTGGIHLLSFSCASYSNIRKWRGGISFYNWMVDGEFYDNLWRESGEGLGFVATGSIVTTQAVSMVLGCGVASLLLVGNDMAFFDRFYASGAHPAERKFFSSGRFNTPSSIDMNRGRAARDYHVKRDGELFYTNNQFLAAKLWLEKLFASAPYPVADSSTPGCSPGSVHKIGLGEYSEIFNNKN